MARWEWRGDAKSPGLGDQAGWARVLRSFSGDCVRVSYVEIEG